MWSSNPDPGSSGGLQQMQGMLLQQQQMGLQPQQQQMGLHQQQPQQPQQQQMGLQQQQQQQQQQPQQQQQTSQPQQIAMQMGAGQEVGSSDNRLHNAFQQLQQWLPDTSFLQALKAQGTGQYRVTMRPENMGHSQLRNASLIQPPANNMQQMNQMQQMQPLSMPPQGQMIFQQQYMDPQQQQYMDSQQPQQQQQIFYMQGSNGEMVPIQVMQMQQPMQMGMYSVDVVNKDPGVPVTLYQAGVKKNRRRRRDPSAPKPARYAWNFFFKENYKKLRAGDDEHYDVQKAFTSIGASLGEKWKSLTEEERAPYVQLAKEDKERYERENKEFLESKSSSTSSSKKIKLDKNISSNKPESARSESDDKGETSPSERNDSGEESVEREGEFDEDVPTSSVHSGDELEMTVDILVTDDDDAFIFMIQKSLRKFAAGQGVNLNIDTATNGEEALKKVLDEKNNYAVITMDKDMGDDIDGFETIKRIRAGGYKGCVLGVSGSDHEVDFNKVGADQALQKGPALHKQVYQLIIEKAQEKTNAKANYALTNSDNNEKETSA